MKSNADRDRQFQLFGWGLFIASAIFFTISSLRNGDLFSVLGSLFFLFACLVFVTPLIK